MPLLILKPFGSRQIRPATGTTDKIETPTLKIEFASWNDQVVIMDLWEQYRWICSAPEWSNTDSKIKQYIAVCIAPEWNTTDSKIPRYHLDKKSPWATAFFNNCYNTRQPPSN